MSKRVAIIDDDKEIDDLVISNEAMSRKFTSAITNGRSVLSDFVTIPVNSLVPFTLKNDSDFKKYPQEMFEQLTQSVKKIGVIEPITVRPLKGDTDKFEIIAGEQRWRASKEADRPVVPAHVLKQCDDEQAREIFSITNVLRRENTMSDLINGWWHYFNAIKSKRKPQIEEMIQSGMLTQEIVDKANESERVARRYAKLHDLIPELIELADQKKLGTRAGEQYSFLPPEKQRDLLRYKSYINNMDKSREIRNLAEANNGVNWTHENIIAILLPAQTQSKMLQLVISQTNDLIKRSIPEKMYPRIPEIIEEALALYKEKHPDHFSE